MKFNKLSDAEKKRVVDFFSKKYSIPNSFWLNVELLKRVNSVWLCSKLASEIANDYYTQSCGILVLLELKSLKESIQARDFFSNNAQFK
jgi:hypothetical protein